MVDGRRWVAPKWRKNGGSEAMATLNVKNLPDALYRKLQARAKRQRRSVAQEVTQILSEVLESPKPLSILELQGLGKENWRSIDAATHVERERAAWD
jgi:plasmid stability protein